jgi:hypothetical protein
MFDTQKLIAMRNAAQVLDLDRMADNYLDLVNEVDTCIPLVGRMIPIERQKTVGKAVLRELAEWLKLPKDMQESSWVELLMLSPPDSPLDGPTNLTKHPPETNRATSIDAPKTEITTIVEQFRFAATEFRDLRSMPNDQQADLAFRKIMDMNGLTQSAWQNGGLRSIDGLVGESETQNLISFFMFNELVGYDELQSTADFPDEYYLCPGLLSKYSSVLQAIHVGNEVNIDTEDVQSARNKYRFEILGYYSHACQVIAKILQNEITFTERPSILPQHETFDNKNDPLVAARRWIALPSTEGGPSVQQRDVVSWLVESGGHMTHADINFKGEYRWQDIRKGASNLASRINKKLEKNCESWRVVPEDKSGCTIVSIK